MATQDGRAGWWALGAATVGLMLGFSNIGVACFGMFIVPLSTEFGWGRGEISIAVLLMNYTMVFVAPLIGLALDRFGVRAIVPGSVLLFAGAIGSLSLLTADIRFFYLMYVLIPIAGAGTIPTAYTRVAVGWFDRYRGLAIGISMAGVGLGATLLPPLIQHIVASYGWRTAYLALAGLILLSLPVILIFLREPNAAQRQALGASRLTGFTFRECLGRGAFWRMALAFPLLGLSTSGLMAHLVPLLMDRDVSPGLAALGASLLGVSLIAGRILCGVLLDRIHAPFVVIAFLLGPVIGLAMLAGGASAQLAFIATLLIGLGIGAELDFMSFLISRYLGQRAYGTVYGVMYAAFAVGAGIGPLLMGYAQQGLGDYSPALWALCGLTAVALIPFAGLGRYPALPGAEPVTQTNAAGTS